VSQTNFAFSSLCHSHVSLYLSRIFNILEGFVIKDTRKLFKLCSADGCALLIFHITVRYLLLHESFLGYNFIRISSCFNC
jgi:hypothetical protein